MAEKHRDEDEIDLGQILSTVWRGKWTLLLTTSLALLLGGFYAFGIAKPQYNARASLMISEQVEDGSSLGQILAGEGASMFVSGLKGGGAAIESQMAVLSSRSMMEELVRDENLTMDPEFNSLLREPGPVSKLKIKLKTMLRGPAPKPKLAQVYNRTIDAVSARMMTKEGELGPVFLVGFTTEEAEKSARLTNKLVSLFIERTIQESLEKNEEYIDRLTGRVTEMEKNLQAAEIAYETFNTEANVISVEAFQALNIQLKDLRDRLSTVELSIAETEAKIKVLKTSTGDDRAVSVAAAANSPELDRLLPAVKAGNPGALEKFNAQAAQILQSLQSDLLRQKARAEALDVSIAQVREKIDLQSDDLNRLMQLEREAGSSKAIYEYFLGRLKGTSGELGIQDAPVKILDPARTPESPIAPKKKMILLFSMILGFLAGAAWVLARHMRYGGIHTALELENLVGVSVMGQIPQIPVKKRSKVLQYLIDKPSSAAAEAVRDLRTSLLLSNIDTPPQVITITSSLPGEGKTTQALALADNMARLGKKVLLIEGDLRQRVFGEYFNMGTAKGILSVLVGNGELDKVITRIDALGIDVLVGETSTANAADVFASNKFHDLIEELRHRYDIIIIDTPPVLLVPDARVIAQKSDSVLYVVKWDSTSVKHVKEGLKLLDTAKIPVSGLVLSQIGNGEQKRLYGSGVQASGGYYQQ